MATPFDLVRQYAELRQAASNTPMPSMGLVRPTRAEIEAAIQRRAQQIAGPPPIDYSGLTLYTGGRVGPGGLVDFGGKKLHSSVVGYAQQIARLFPTLRFTSGYRDPIHNRRVGGVPRSYHLKGRAMDWVGPARDMQAAREWALAHGAREALIHNAGSGTHLHVAW